MFGVNGLAVVKNDLVETYSETSFQTDLTNFLAYMKQHGRKETTIRTYDSAIRSVYDRMKDNIGMVSPFDLTPDIVREVNELLSDLKETSRKLYINTLGRFCYITTGKNPVADSDILWNQTECKRIFIDVDEYKKMYASGDSLERLVFALGAYMGLRRSEIANIRLSDMKGKFLTVRGKGHGINGKMLDLPIHPNVMPALDEYLKIRANIANEHSRDYLLLKPRGLIGYPLGSGGVYNVVKRMGKRNNVEITPHSLRRLYATVLYYDCGTDLNTLKGMMRHNDIRTTMECYIEANPMKRDTAMLMLGNVLG